MRPGEVLNTLLRGKHVGRWLAIAGAVAVSITGGYAGFMDSDSILQLWLALIAGILGVQALGKPNP